MVWGASTFRSGASTFGAGRVYFWWVGRVFFWCGARLLLVVLDRVYWGASTFGVGHVSWVGARLFLGGRVLFLVGCGRGWGASTFGATTGASSFGWGRVYFWRGARLLLFRARLLLEWCASTFCSGRVYYLTWARLLFGRARLFSGGARLSLGLRRGSSCAAVQQRDLLHVDVKMVVLLFVSSEGISAGESGAPIKKRPLQKRQFNSHPQDHPLC